MIVVVRKSAVARWIYLIAVAAITLWLHDSYTEADGRVYSDYYDQLRDLRDVGAAYELYRNQVGASEPVYFALTYLGSRFLSRLSFLLIANMAFALAAFEALRKLAPHPVVFLGLLSNYYILVLLLPAERLKIGATFFLISLLVSDWRKWVATVVSIGSHLQWLVATAARYSWVIYESMRGIFNLRVRRGRIATLIAILGIVVLTAVTLGSAIVEKLLAYRAAASLADLARPGLFLLLSLVYSRGQYRAVLVLNAPIIIAAAFVGSERLTIFSAALFVYFACQVRRGMNIGMFAFIAYFAAKSVNFMINVAEYGHGF